MNMIDYHRKVEHLSKAMDEHYTECDKETEDCLRCQNLKSLEKELLAETPGWLLKMVVVFMWVRHPIQMTKARGNVSGIH